MANEHVCPCTVGCPLQKAMNAIGGRWKMSILCSLSNDGPTRYNDIKRKMGSISNTMLAKSLKELEEDGLVKRTEYMEVPIRVEYEITDSVRSNKGGFILCAAIQKHLIEDVLHIAGFLQSFHEKWGYSSCNLS